MISDLVADPGQWRDMAAEAVELIERYYSELPGMPVMPRTSARAVEDLLREPLPVEGTTAGAALAAVRDIVYPLSRHNAHPRFFGYVASPGSAAATLGDLLAGGLNANVTSWRSAPAAAEMELLVVEWLKSMIGANPASGGLLVSGGSMANFSGLAAARAAADPGFGRSGGGARPPLRIYVSAEGHFSIHKAARLLGIGSDNVQPIATDLCFKIDIADLEARIEADRRAGLRPMCIVANAGTVNTGAVDPIEDLAAVAARHQLWLHVDGAYGAFAAMAPSTRHLFAGLDRADSISLDPHKWLYSSVGCGCVLYRDPSAAAAAFGHDAEYTRPVGLTDKEAFAFWDFGPELSRPFRALPIWLHIKLYGARKLAEAVENNLACARYFENLVNQSDDFEMLAPLELSIFCFRFKARSGDLDALNERILVELQRAGSSYLSNARVKGRFALRGCVLNYRTSRQDMERLLDDVRRAAATVGP